MSRPGTWLTRSALPFLVTGLLSPAVAQAYDAENTHRWIARKAAEYLVASYPGEYDEVLEYTEDVVEGAHHEDDFFLDGDDDPKTLRVMRHFYHATEGVGLTYGDATFPNSYEWNALPNEQNQWDYHDGLHAYQKGDYAQAYFIAGHTLHLIADLTVPAHSHLDDHGPPEGDDYENHCSSRMRNAYESSLRQPAPGTPIPEFPTLADAFQQTAEASYFRNLYPGNLEGEEPQGVIADMFPEMSKGFLSGVWEIDGIGREGRDFYMDEPGYYYFSENSAPSSFDIVDYDPADPRGREYGPIESEAPMVERMADDLVPIAILHSASVLKFFVDEARLLPTISADELLGEEEGGCNASSSRSAPWLALFLLLPLWRAAARRRALCPKRER